MSDETTSTAPTRLLRDDDCPSCGWPETYAEVDLTAETPGADAHGCSKCGWRTDATHRYTVTFERIGRRHDVEPLEVEANHPDVIAEQVFTYARRFLGSRWFDVVVDLGAGTVSIEAGRFGRGTVAVSA